MPSNWAGSKAEDADTVGPPSFPPRSRCRAARPPPRGIANNYRTLPGSFSLVRILLLHGRMRRPPGSERKPEDVVLARDRPMAPQLTRGTPGRGATTPDYVCGSILLLVAPTTIVASVLAECFKDASDIRVIQDRRRPWPRSERRRMMEPPDVERRCGERRRSSRFRFLGAVVAGAE